MNFSPNALVALIDDDQDDQEIFIAALKAAAPYARCVTFDTAINALEAIKAGHIKPDVYFLDLNMPRKSGQEFLKEYATIPVNRHAPVIVLSTSERAETIANTLHLGATEFISKPESFSQLVRLLQPYFAQ